MKSRLLKFVYFTVIILAVFTSCKKDFLDQSPELDLSEEKVFSDINLAEQFVNDIYASLPWPFIMQRMLTMQANITDEAFDQLGWSDAHPFNAGSYLNPSQWTMGEIWNQNYAAIRKTNLVIEKADAITDPVPTDELTPGRLKGEALFLRAFFYFELAKRFGGVPLVTSSLDPSQDLLSIDKRATFEEVITQMVKDCDDAAPLLKTSYDPSLLGRVTKGACLALKSRALLFLASPLNNPSNDVAKWQAAADAAKAFLDMPGSPYSLYPDYEKMFVTAGNSEMIFERKVGQFEWAQKDNFMDVVNNPGSPNFGGWGGATPTQNFVDLYEMNNARPISDPASGYNPQDPYKNRDPRFYQSVLYNGSTWKGRTMNTYAGGSEAFNTVTNAAGTRTSYNLRKFLMESAINIYDLTINHDWPFIRLAEIYLNYAEALNEAVGPTSEVYAAIRAIRQRPSVMMPDWQPGLSQSQMRDRIRNERAIELAFEEHRFWDVRRWKLGSQIFTQPIKGLNITTGGTGAGGYNYTPFTIETRVFTEKMYLFPIPQSEINKNREVLMQNPGW